jgi:hypothetical protein
MRAIARFGVPFGLLVASLTAYISNARGACDVNDRPVGGTMMDYRFGESSTWSEKCYGAFSMGWAQGSVSGGKQVLYVDSLVNGATIQAIGIDSSGNRVPSCLQSDTAADGSSVATGTSSNECGAAVRFEVSDVGIPLFSFF